MCGKGKGKTPFLLGQNLLQKFLTLAWGRGGGGRRLLAWTGRRGLLAWIRSQGKKFAMLTCDEQEVSAQLGCLCLSLSAYLRRGWGNGTTQARIKQGKKKRRETTTPNIITPKERGKHVPLSNALRRGGFLYSHYFLFHSGIIIQIFCLIPPPPMITRVVPHLSTLPPPPAAASRGMVLSRWGRPGDEVGRAGIC